MQRLIGAISIKEDEHLIHIDGLPANVIVRDIVKIWETSRIGKYMFSSAGRSSISFNKFFAPDVAYTFSEVLRKSEGRYNYRALRKVLEMMYEHTWLKQTVETGKSKFDWSRLNVLARPPLDHQKEFLRSYDENTVKYGLNGYWLASPPGTGKTYASLAISLLVSSKVTICIVPKNSIDLAWKDAFEKEFKEVPKYWMSNSGTPPAPGCQYYVFHYEQLEAAIAFMPKLKMDGITILLDESHNMNEMTAGWTNHFLKLCKVTGSKNILWSSGTHLKAAGSEAIPFLLSVDPLFDDDAHARFKGIFSKNATKALDILAHRMGIIVYEVDKKLVVDNKVTTFQKNVKMPGGELYTMDSISDEVKNFIIQRMKYYEDNMADFVHVYEYCLKLYEDSLATEHDKADLFSYRANVAMIRKSYDPVTMKEMVKACNKFELSKVIPFLPKQYKEPFNQSRSVVKYYYLKVQGEALGRILGRKRAECHVKMIPYVGLETMIDTAVKKTIIFTDYVEVVDETEKYLISKGYKPLKVYGDTNKDLAKIVHRFANEEDANPMITTFKSLSTAVPLTMASTVVYMNHPFRDYIYVQSLSRLDRLDQDSPITAWNVFLDTGEKSNISTRSGDIMLWSRAQVAAIMGRNVDLVLDLAMEKFVDPMIAHELDMVLANESKPSWARW